jgi:hypothetical protein
MKLNKDNKVRRVSGMFAALLAIIMVFTVPSVVLAQTAEVPTLTVGDSAYFGGVKDIGEEYKTQIDDALQQYEDMGFNINYDISGGMGAYMGWEVVSNSADINGNTCYDLKLTGALAINIGFDGSVDGNMDLGSYGGTVTVDGSGSGFVEFEATLDGHMYLTVDEMAIAKIQLTIKADGKLEFNIDATASMSAQNMVMKADATASIDGAQLDFLLEFDPPMDIYQFPISLGDTWYVPSVDTQASGSVNAQGIISYDVNAEITGQEPTHDTNTTNLATEIGNNNFDETIPGGAPDMWGYGGGLKFNCSKVSGDIFIIEMDMLGMMDTSSMLPGTRQFSGLDPASMMPSTGMQFDKNKGMITGMTLDGQAMTSEVPKAEVDSFVASPMEDLTAETGGRSASSGSLLMILVIVIVIVVVIVVVVMVAMRKKIPPAQQQHPQPMYQQPPPPPQQYPPQDQYGQQQYPPQQQGQYPPPPPPPDQ